MKFKMIDGFPNNGFTDKLLAELELNYIGNIHASVHKVYASLNAHTAPSFDSWLEGETITIRPFSFHDCLLFVGLNVKETLNNESLLVRDRKIMYSYYDGKLVGQSSLGYYITYIVGPDQRLSFGYSGPLFREYKERLLLEVGEESFWPAS
jgi:hypothetical protein